jgi:hypothetical protein
VGTFDKFDGQHRTLEQIAGKHDTLEGALAAAQKAGLIETPRRGPTGEATPSEPDHQGAWVKNVLGKVYGAPPVPEAPASKPAQPAPAAKVDEWSQIKERTPELDKRAQREYNRVGRKIADIEKQFASLTRAARNEQGKIQPHIQESITKLQAQHTALKAQEASLKAYSRLPKPAPATPAQPPEQPTGKAEAPPAPAPATPAQPASFAPAEGEALADRVRGNPSAQPWERSGADRVRMLAGAVRSPRTPDVDAVAGALEGYAMRPEHLKNEVGRAVDTLGRQALARLDQAGTAALLKQYESRLSSPERRAAEVPPAILDHLRQHAADRPITADVGGSLQDTTVGELLAGGEPRAPFNPTAHVPRLLQAVGQHGGPHNLADLVHVRQSLDDLSPAQQDQVIAAARRLRLVSGSKYEGRQGTTPEQQAAKHGQGDEAIGYLSVRGKK